MYRNRFNYWSCSKFANWLLKDNNKPVAATQEEWKKWREDLEAARPFRYWFVEEFLDRAQNVVYFPYDVYQEIRSYVLNRYVTKTHALTSNLKRGQYHELDDRLLHCMFDELVNFVEIEKAHMQRWLDDTGKWKKIPRRCPEAGIEYLTWEMGLTYDESWGTEPTSERYQKSTPQAQNAATVLELYKWWKEVYPHRPDPYEASGWNDYCARYPRLDGQTKNAKQEKEAKAAMKKLDDLEKAYSDEDERMMIKLIKIRQGLWT